MKRAARGPASLLAALFGRMGLLFLVMVLAVGSAAFITAQNRIDEIYDGQLIIGANVLRALMGDEIKEQAASARGGAPASELTIDDDVLSPEDREAFDNYADWRMFRVWRGPRLALRSDTGPPLARPPPGNGFTEVDGPQDRWRIYTLHVANSDVAVQVGERMDIRLVLVQGIALGLVLPLLLLVPIAALLIWLSLRDGLKALRGLIEEIGQRTMRDMSPIGLDGWPRDLQPLVRSMNLMFARIDRALSNERRFLDDAAHQLRTPLSAIKLQAQMIGDEDDPAERRLLAGQLVESVDRAAALTDRLLTLARLQSMPDSGAAGDLRQEAVETIADLAPVAARRGVALAFDGREAVPSGDPILLRLIVANLLENAVRHAPARSEVRVAVAARDGSAVLSVVDAGPGIPPREREKVLQRFYRGPAAEPGGAGLGLSIVGQAAQLLGGRVELKDRDDGAQGLEARVSLPLRLENAQSLG